MRVTKSGTRRGTFETKKTKRARLSENVDFSNVLEAEQEREIDLVKALAEIEEYARRLRENPVYEHLFRYKEKVRALLRFLVSQAYTVRESSFYDPRGRRRLMMVVESVDQQLEALTRDFLSSQGGSLDLVSRLDEIRGLILDLYS